MVRRYTLFLAIMMTLAIGVGVFVPDYVAPPRAVGAVVLSNPETPDRIMGPIQPSDRYYWENTPP